MELGKIINENPYYVFTDIKGKSEHYNDKIDDRYYGICKSISELYVSILADKRIGISAELAKKSPESPLTHVDTILKIDGKNYLVNLISDLSRIKTSRRVNSFGIDLRRVSDPEINKDNELYLNRLEQQFGRIDSLSREEIEILDKKLGYSYSIPQFARDDRRGFYTEDTLELLKKEINNPENFKKYVLHDKDVPKDEILIYKMDYIFENINKFTYFNGKMNYLERIRYIISIGRRIFSPDEVSRIHSYVVSVGDDLSNLISIIKVSPAQDSDKKNVYYLYSQEKQVYIKKTPEEMNQFLDSIDKNSIKIVGMFDRYNPRETEELEL